MTSLMLRLTARVSDALQAAGARIRDAFSADSDPHVALYCPRVDGEVAMATERDDPLYWTGPNDDVAVYDYDVCGGRHGFLWGPPAPLHVPDATDLGGDADGE